MSLISMNHLSALIEARQSSLRKDAELAGLARRPKSLPGPGPVVLGRLSLFRTSVRPTASRTAA
jgi:hypothetical protein